MPDLEFVKFPKIPRLSRDMIVTEKLDGTNAQIIVPEDGPLVCGSRNRVITSDQDNYGFAAWVQENEEELRTLGPGRYYGEWWGRGIQRGYGLSDRRFSLFHAGGIKELPSCVSVVPTLCTRQFDTGLIESHMEILKHGGSVAAPGFMNPEGVIVFHTGSRQLYKYTFDNEPKGKNNAQ